MLACAHAHTHTHTHFSIQEEIGLFTIVKVKNQPGYLLADGWVKKMHQSGNNMSSIQWYASRKTQQITFLKYYWPYYNVV